MENNANQLNQNLCKKNCGFFGSSAFDGYCSKCYKDHVKRQNSGTAAGVLQSNLNSSSTNILTTTTTTTTTDIPNTIDSTTTTISNNEPIAVDNVETPQQPQIVLPDNAIEIDNQPTVTFTLQEQEPQVQQQPEQQQQQQLLQTQAIVVDEASSSSQDMSPVASSGDLTSSNDNKKKKTRCMVDTCRRKVGLTGFDCRCGGLYCGEHRYSDKHNCNFDYKQHGQDQIRKNNPIVVGEKIQKL